MKFTSISRSRESLRALSRDGEDVLVLRDNKPIAVMLPIAHYEAMHVLASLAIDSQAQAQMDQLHAEAMAGTTAAGDLEDYDHHRAEQGRVASAGDYAVGEDPGES